MELASEVNIKDLGLVCAQESNQKEQRIDIDVINVGGSLIIKVDAV